MLQQRFKDRVLIDKRIRYDSRSDCKTVSQYLMSFLFYCLCHFRKSAQRLLKCPSGIFTHLSAERKLSNMEQINMELIWKRGNDFVINLRRMGNNYIMLMF